MKIKDKLRNALKMGNKPEPKGDSAPSKQDEESEVPAPQESKDETAFFSARDEDSSSCSSICNESHRRRRVSSAASEASLKSGRDDSDAGGISGEVFDNSEDGENCDGKSNEALAGSISSAKDEVKIENEQVEDKSVENSPNEETLRKKHDESESEEPEKDVNDPLEHDGTYENLPHDISDHHEEYSFVEPVEEVDPIPIGQTIAPEVFFKSYQKYVDSHAPKEVPDQGAEEEEKDEERSEGSCSEGNEDQNDVSAEELESRQGSEDEEVTEKDQKVEKIVDDSHGQGIDEGQVDSSHEVAEFSCSDDEFTPPQSPAKIQPGNEKISEQNEAPVEAPQADKIAMDEVRKPCHFSVPERPLIDQSALFVKATSPRTLPYLTVDQTEFEYKEITPQHSSHYEDIIHENFEKIEPAEPYDGLEWFTDEPSPQYPSGRLPHSIFDNFDKRRVRRVHAYQITDDRPIDLPEPVDYLISYNDTYTAVGFVKSPINAKHSAVPISIRFGGFWAKNWLGRIYLGCTVRVKQYVLTCKNLHTDLVEFQSGDRDYAVRDLFGSGVPVASTFATQWAVVEQPKIVRSLGIVLGVEPGTSLFDFTATIGDVEYNQKLTASIERWPADLKEPPKVARPVLINWVYVEQPHALFWTRGSFVVLPPHLSHIMHPAKGVSEDRYVFGGVDLTSEPSRPTIKCNAKKL
uniref:Protein CASC3 n=2 Tax=Bursaphelenchus xylophilus TaxID=6326 RepID=A0A1I7RJA4_BURXY